MLPRWITNSLLWTTGYQAHLPPRMIAFEATNYCNQRCPVCGAQEAEHAEPLGFMAWDVFRQLADEAENWGVRTVWLYARGESLLHPRLTDMIWDLNQRGLATHLSTNGLLLDAACSRTLAQAGLDQLTVSHPGVSANNYLACRGQTMPDNLDQRLAEAAEAWHAAGRSLDIQVLLLPSHLQENGVVMVTQFLTLWLSRPGVRNLMFTGYQPWPRNIREDLLPALYARGRTCNLTFDMLTVFWDGTITPCSYDARGELAVGRWPEMSLRRAFNCPQTRRIRRNHCWRTRRQIELCSRCLMPRASAPLFEVRADDVAALPEIERPRRIDRLARQCWHALSHG